MWWDHIVANPPTPQTVAVYNSYVDVRDVALAHVLALQKPGAGGERLLIVAGQSIFLRVQSLINPSSTIL
jgi:nucleoside-diphosphate-sugar epimerase